MEQYIVSARKYRPDSFESLIGQDNIVQTLKNSIIRGQLAHAYLFCGPRGVGKTSAARIFAKTINCANPTPEMEPCGKCESCISFQEGRSYCIHELDAASNNGVDDIKALIEQVNIPPQIGKYSVYIVDEVHMLSQSAFNAFLKTLEEPPAHAIFILATTEKHKILPTILSRCQTYDFNRISIPDIVGNLRDIAEKEGVKIGDESLHIIARKADGAMRDALTIFDQTVAFCGNDVNYEEVMKNLNVLDYEHCFQLVDDFLVGNYQAALLKFDEVLSRGFNALHFVSALSSHLRDLLVTRSGGLDSLLELPSSLKAKYSEQASRCQLKFLYDALNITTQCESEYMANVNPRLHIEIALMKLSFLNGGLPQQGAEAGGKAAPDRATASGEQAASTADSTAQGRATTTSATASESKDSEDPAIIDKPKAKINSGGQKSEKAPEIPAPEKSGKGRKRPAKTAAALSISSIKEEDAKGGMSGDPVPDGFNDIIPEDEAIVEAWKEIPKNYKDRPRLATTLSSSKIKIEEKDGIKSVTFYVMSDAQKTWIEEKLLNELERRFQLIAGSSKLRLLVDVEEDDDIKKRPYLPKDKAIELINSNPEVKHLVKDLELDTKL
jgi:hypothetical protein